MIATLQAPDTLDDLLKVDGKAELISGRIVHLMASGELPSSIAFEIAVLLREYAKILGRGKAYTDGTGFAIDPPLLNRRESFSPDVAFHYGPPPVNRMRFIDGAPAFAVEVRSENDYGPKAERAMADKRADYFEAGTAVVWDVDTVMETITKHTVSTSTTYRVGDIADAEPAIPGWRVEVSQLFA